MRFTTHQRQSLWDNLEELLRQSLAAVRPQISASEAKLVDEYIDHIEFGLAYELLLGMLQEGEVPLTAITSQRLNEAAKLVGP